MHKFKCLPCLKGVFKMKSKLISAALIVCMIFSFTACTGAKETKTEETTVNKILGQEAEEGSKYTLYIGLNDKDAGGQIVGTEYAMEEANTIVGKYASGFTRFTAYGGWTNKDGSMGHENTIVYIIYDISEKDLQKILDELLETLNQSSILVEKEDVSHIYYGEG